MIHKLIVFLLLGSWSLFAATNAPELEEGGNPSCQYPVVPHLNFTHSGDLGKFWEEFFTDVIGNIGEEHSAQQIVNFEGQKVPAKVRIASRTRYIADFDGALFAAHTFMVDLSQSSVTLTRGLTRMGLRDAHQHRTMDVLELTTRVLSGVPNDPQEFDLSVILQTKGLQIQPILVDPGTPSSTQGGSFVWFSPLNSVVDWKLGDTNKANHMIKEQKTYGNLRNLRGIFIGPQ